MEHKNITVLVIIDLNAAFDTADHKVLLKVLQKSFGIESMVWSGSVVIYHQDFSKSTLVRLTQI